MIKLTLEQVAGLRYFDPATEQPVASYVWPRRPVLARLMKLGYLKDIAEVDASPHHVITEAGRAYLASLLEE
jgi:hypothetical protein